jgi:Na+/H+-dicarboxylate symporter
MSIQSAESTATPATDVITRHILVGLLAGLACGLAINLLAESSPTAPAGEFLLRHGANGILLVVGQAFLRLLQVLVVPLVLTSLIAGTAGLDNVRQLGRIGVRTAVLYMFTTAAAVTFALLVALAVRPGEGLSLQAEATGQPQARPSLIDTLIGMFPRNIFAALSAGEMIPVIVFAILFGIALTLSGDQGRRLRTVTEDASAVMMTLVGIVMRLAPIGVFALIARTFANEGLAVLLPLVKFVLLTIITLLAFAFLFYPALVKVLSGLDPRPLLRGIRELQLFAFATASSNASIPLSMRAMRRLGVDPSLASFSASCGATLNMDGTAIMQGIATVFIAQIHGVDLGAGQLAMVVLTATLAAIGTAGVPGAGVVMLSMVLLQVGLPVESIALILGVDRILDMVRTAVNVSGDVVIACIVARGERRLDEIAYYGKTVPRE